MCFESSLAVCLLVAFGTKRLRHDEIMHRWIRERAARSAGRPAGPIAQVEVPKRTD